MALVVLEADLGQGARLIEYGKLKPVRRNGVSGTRCGSRLPNRCFGREKLRSVFEAQEPQQDCTCCRGCRDQQPMSDWLRRQPGHGRCRPTDASSPESRTDWSSKPRPMAGCPTPIITADIPAHPATRSHRPSVDPFRSRRSATCRACCRASQAFPRASLAN